MTADFPTWITADDGVITATGWGTPPPDAIHEAGSVLVPAFVDLQVNGVGTDDLAVADDDGWLRVARRLAHAGVGAWCPTLVTSPRDAYEPFLVRAERVRAACSAAGLPEILGVHLEGPFLAPEAAGAHDPAWITPADPAWMAHLLDAHPSVIRVVTLAPEADPDGACTRLLATRGVTVSIGHTRASGSATRVLVDAGATAATHLFNAMAPLHHREVGSAGVALTDPRVRATLIADGVHVAPSAVRIAFAATDRLAVVSDCVATDASRVSQGDAVRLAESNTLAGATVLLDGAVENLCRWGVSFERAIDAVTRVPAALVGASHRGTLAPGAPADVVACDPTSGAIRAVWHRGRRSHHIG